jgi:hypothetical protein
LPSGAKSFIFVKVPQGWVLPQGAQEVASLKLIEETVGAFLRNTDRVASVKLYANYVVPSVSWAESGFKVREIHNPNAGDPNTWRLLDERRLSHINPRWLTFGRFVGSLDGY